MIGVAVTTRNRPRSLQRTLDALAAFKPPDALTVVVDDAGTQRVERATYRFESNVGIARAKNKCLELLDGCEHIFLFDDDCRPIKDGWWEPYIESPLPHLMYVFKASVSPLLNDQRHVVGEADGAIAWNLPRGCLLYLHRSALDAVGGMDPAYGKWGYEHADLSNRIHAAGLTPFPYMDVPGSDRLIHSEDEHGEVASSVPAEIRRRLARENLPRFLRSRQSSQFIDYREARA